MEILKRELVLTENYIIASRAIEKEDGTTL